MADAASPLSPVQQELALLRQRVADLEAAQAAQDLAEKVIETIRDPLLIRKRSGGLRTPNSLK